MLGSGVGVVGDVLGSGVGVDGDVTTVVATVIDVLSAADDFVVTSSTCVLTPDVVVTVVCGSTPVVLAGTDDVIT